jgi:hypothetical protein
VPLPASLQGLEVSVVDGQAMKREAKRLKPLPGRKGGVGGGKALVALELRRGLAVAMATAPEGESNAAKLVPALLPPVREYGAGVRLGVAARHFCDLTQTAAFTTGAAHFLVRYHAKPHCCPAAMPPAQAGQDAHSRGGVEDGGWLGGEQAKPRRLVRRMTLVRSGEEPLILLTDLLDAGPYPANALLARSLARWGIERGFQQIPAVLPLQTRIGTTPQGTVFQGAFCLLLYHLGQGVRAYVAMAQTRPVEPLSTELLFADVQRQLVAVTELVPAAQLEPLCAAVPSAGDLCDHLTALLASVWTPRGLKAPAKKRKVPTPRTPIRGNQTSVYRLITVYNKPKVNHLSY